MNVTAASFPKSPGAPGAAPRPGRGATWPHQGDIVDYYEDALFQIPGVESVGFDNSADHKVISVDTRSPEAASFVRDLLEPKIDGFPVEVKEISKPIHEPQFELTGADSVASRYGDALKHIRHVTDVHGESGKLVVGTDSQEAATALDRLIADSVRGVPVQFTAPAGSHDPSINAWGWSSWD